MKEIKEKFRRKIDLQQQRPVDKRVAATKMRSRSKRDWDLNKSQDNVFRFRRSSS